MIGFALDPRTAMGQTEASHLWWHSRASSSTQLPATKDEEFTHFRLPAPHAAFEKLKLQVGCLLKRWLHAAEWFAAFRSIYSLLSHSNYFFFFSYNQSHHYVNQKRATGGGALVEKMQIHPCVCSFRAEINHWLRAPTMLLKRESTETVSVEETLEKRLPSEQPCRDVPSPIVLCWASRALSDT